jgi:methyl-accepting chemotaxis protein
VPLNWISRWLAIGPPTQRPWMHDVRTVIAELEKLNHATEDDFLAVGRNLMAFLSSARQLHADIGGLTALVSGEQAQHACETLLAVRGYAVEIRRHFDAGGRALLILQTGADRIRDGFRSFEKIASSFSVTATLARIEAGRLAESQQNLKNLADDVRSCSDSIKSRANQVVDAVIAFHARVAATLFEVSRSDTMEQKELPALLLAVDADLEMFKSRQQEAAGATLKLSADLRSVDANLRDIATSIQFHDITRQQVEHVIEALEGLLTAAPVDALSASGAAQVRLQKDQLRSAAAAFASSTKTIESDLASIDARVRKMAAASLRIQDVDQQERDSFLGGMHRQFGAIAQAVAELHSLQRAARAAIAGLDQASESMGKAVKEVQSIQSQLNLLSVNAVVSASHMGAQGQVIIVIGGAIRELGMESILRSDDAKAALHSIGQAIQSLAGDEASNDNDASGAILLQDLKTRAGDLQSGIALGAAAAAMVADLAHNLCSNLEAARSHFVIGRLFAETVQRCCDLLDVVISQAQPPRSSDAPLLEQTLDDRYTMRAEREVHQASARGWTSLPPEAANAPAPETADDVEFF